MRRLGNALLASNQVKSHGGMKKILRWKRSAGQPRILDSVLFIMFGG